MIELLRSISIAYGENNCVESFIFAIILQLPIEFLRSFREFKKYSILKQLSIFDEKDYLIFYPKQLLLQEFLIEAINDAMIICVAECVSKAQVKSAQIYISHTIMIQLLEIIVSICVLAFISRPDNLLVLAINEVLETFASLTVAILVSIGRISLVSCIEVIRLCASIYYISYYDHNIGTDKVINVLEYSELVDVIPCIILSFIFLIKEFKLFEIIPKLYSYYPINGNILAKIFFEFLSIILTKTYFLECMYKYGSNTKGIEIDFIQIYNSEVHSCDVFVYIFIATTSQRIINFPALSFIFYFEKEEIRNILWFYLLAISTFLQIINDLVIAFYSNVILDTLNLEFSEFFFLAINECIFVDIMLKNMLVKKRMLSVFILSLVEPIEFFIIIIKSMVENYTLDVEREVEFLLYTEFGLYYAFVFVLSILDYKQVNEDDNIN